MVKRVKIKKSEAASRLVGGSLLSTDSRASTKEPSRSPLHSLATSTNTPKPTASSAPSDPSTAKPRALSIHHDEQQTFAEATVADTVSERTAVRPKKHGKGNPLESSQSEQIIIVTAEPQSRRKSPTDATPKKLRVTEENPTAINSDGDADIDSPTDDIVNGNDTKQSSLIESRDGALTSVPLLSHRIQQCWVCSVQLEFPADEVAYYRKYAHPIFPATNEDEFSSIATDRNDSLTNTSIFVCSECAPALVENDKEYMKLDSNATDNTCGLCLEDDHHGPLLLCDGCPRQVCQVCVACCNGGGAKGAQHTKQVAELDKTWMCPICKPPNALMEVAKSQASLLRPAHHTLEDLLALLEDVELMKKEAETTLEDYEVEDDEEWKRNWEAHDRRLLDTISHIQEELEAVHNVDLSQVYQKRLKQEKPVVPNQLEAWAEAAEKEIQQRYDNMPQKEWGRFRDQFTDVIEDLETEESETTTFGPLIKPKAKGWSSTQPCAHPEDIEEAFANEDAIIAKQHIKLMRVSEETDQTIISKETSSRAITRPYLNDFSKAKSNLHKTRDKITHAVSSLPPEDDSKTDHVLQVCTTSDPTDFSAQTLNTSLTNDKGASEQNMPQAGPLTPSKDAPSKHVINDNDKMQDSSTVIHDALDVPPRSGLDVSGNTTIQEFSPTNSIKEILKSHQLEGMQFLGRNCFGDCIREGGQVSGALLAHSMGLGKTLTSIALVHTVFVNNLGHSRSEGKPRILICVPTNTLLNWQHEFEKWDCKMIPRMDPPLCLSDASNTRAKEKMTDRWVMRGGVMLCTHGQVGSCENLAKADLVINDEAHATLKNPKTNAYRNLSRIGTKRRVALTGTPIQNNLAEYHAMIQWVQPGLLPEKLQFERDYIDPINAGLVSDCTPAEHQRSLNKTADLHQILDPYVQRKSASLLAEMLPPIQQSVLYLQQSKLQSRLYTSLKRFQKRQEKTSFFVTVSALRHINNAPGALPLCLRSRKEAENKDESVVKWWEGVMKKYGSEELSRVEHSHKIILLLHILVMATQMGDKTIVFSQSLSTLDYVESILERDWSQLCPSLSDLICKTSFGGGRWKRDRDYLRIDGSVTADERGDRIQEFEKDGSAFKLFLLSTVAGGVGINLVAANRVVLLDTHFNPSLSEQAIFRSYRYGQTKPTFVYRLLMKNSIEEKIYARTVTKTGLALRVIDKKTIEKHFSRQEIADLNNNLEWVQCEKCEKWRVPLVPLSKEELPDQWFCSMNSDPQHNKCSDPERSAAWYEAAESRKESDSGNEVALSEENEAASTISKEERNTVEQANDTILQHLLTLSQGRTKRKIVSNSKFHDFLVAPKRKGEILQQDSQDNKRIPRSPGSSKQSSRTKRGENSPMRKEIPASSPKRPNSSKRKVAQSSSVANQKKGSSAASSRIGTKPSSPVVVSNTREVIKIDDFEDDGDCNRNQVAAGRGNESMASSSRNSRRRRNATDRYEPKDDKQRLYMKSKKRQKVTSSKARPAAATERVIDLCDSD